MKEILLFLCLLSVLFYCKNNIIENYNNGTTIQLNGIDYQNDYLDTTFNDEDGFLVHGKNYFILRNLPNYNK